MYRLSSHIIIGSLEFRFVNEVEIQDSLKEYTGTAVIRQAKNIQVKNANGWSTTPIYQIIKRGDPVQIYLGYDDNLKLEFKGYVRQAHPRVPLEIECEDDMFILKNRTVKAKVFNGGKISDIIDYIAPEYKADILDSSLGGRFIIGSDSPTAVKVLEKIEEVYGLKSFFRLVDGEPMLIVGKAYSSDALLGTLPVQYRVNQNTIGNDLQFISGADVRVKIEGSSLQSDGKKLKAKFTGDEDGDVKSFAIPGLTQAELEAYARRLYEESKKDRFDGDFTTFGVPYIQKGMSATILGTKYEINRTTNYVDSVTTRFGTSGFRRTITLGPKAA